MGDLLCDGLCIVLDNFYIYNFHLGCKESYAEIRLLVRKTSHLKVNP